MPRTDAPRLFDVNVLVALCATDHVHHVAAHQALASLVGPWSTCPSTEGGLVRLLLNQAVMGQSLDGATALGVLRGLRAHPAWTFLTDDSSLAEPGIDLTALVGRQQVTDLHLVNLCARAGHVLATFDQRIASSLGRSDRHHVDVLPT